MSISNSRSNSRDDSNDTSQIFDREELLASIHGDRELLEQFIQLFHTDFPPKIELLRSAAGDAQALRNGAHKILGSAKTMRLKRLATAAQDLQHLIDSESYQPTELTAAADRVIDEYHRVVTLLTR